VSGLTAAVSQLRVTLTNLNHSYSDDLDLLLVGPQGQSVLLMSDAGATSLSPARTSSLMTPPEFPPRLGPDHLGDLSTQQL
jgi:hypothetical protein